MSVFQHVIRPGTAPVTLLLLHGTGGDERSLLDIGSAILPDATLLSPTGQVNEGGANRWFRRFGEGVFDEVDMRHRASELAAFIRSVAPSDQPIVAIGYSNGANMGAALMTLYPDLLAGLVMWRGMKVFEIDPAADLAGKHILMLNGTNDPFAPADSASEQAERFKSCGATIRFDMSAHSHGLSSKDIDLTQLWVSDFQSHWQI